MLSTLGNSQMAKFRTRLKELMEQHGLSRMDMVRRADMTYPTVVSWESDMLKSVDANKVHILTQLFDCKIDDLIYTIDDEEEPA